jgi:hypothetical protein
LGAYIGADPGAVRSLFIFALRLVDEIELWARSRPESETVLQLYLATAPPPVDWLDRAGLAAAVVDILHFLADQGYLRISTEPPDPAFRTHLDQALTEFDWLDRDRLRAGLLSQISAPDSHETSLPVRPTDRGATPRQRELLTDLIALIQRGRLKLDRNRPDSPANALRLYALLVESVPSWAGDSLVTGTVQRLLAAWAWLIQARFPTEVTRWLRQGDVEAALRLLPEAKRAMARSSLGYLAGLGEPGIIIAEMLAHTGKGASSASDEKMLQRLFDSGQTGLASVIQHLAGLDTAEMSLIKAVLASASAETLRQLRHGGVREVLAILADVSRASVPGLLQALAGLQAGDLALVKAILAGASTETLYQIGQGEFEAWLPIISDNGRARIARLLEVLVDLDSGDVAVITAFIAGGSVEPQGRLRQGDVGSVLPGLSDEGRARIVGVLDSVANLEEAELALVKASFGGATPEMLRRLRQGDVESLVNDLCADFYDRVTAVSMAYEGLDEPGMALAKLLTIGGTVESLHWLEERDIATALQTLLEDSGSRILRVFESLADLEDADLAQVKALVGGNADAQALDGGINTGCAGVFLLLRAILDARLPVLVKDAGYPSQERPRWEPDSEQRRGVNAGPTPLGVVLIALGLRWAGEAGLIRGRIDAGLGVLAMPERPLGLGALRAAWSHTRTEDHFRFQAALLRVLVGQRLVRGSVMRVYLLNDSVLVAGFAGSGRWPLGQTLETAAEARGILDRWLDVWEKTTGTRPDFITCDGPLARAVDFNRVTASDDVVVMSPSRLSAAGGVPDGLIESHLADRQALLAALDALEEGRLDLPDADLTLALTAVALLRLWARWLGQFEASSVPYLLDNFIRRPGRIYVDADHILVEIEPGPLDIVMEMAGYTTELERLPWLGARHVRFQLRD